MNYIADELDRLELLSGNSLKAALAEDAHPMLQQVLRAALDPMRVYGIKQVELFHAGASAPEDIQWVMFWGLLDRLASRSLTGNVARSEVSSIISCAYPKNQKWMLRILQKDLRIGADVTTVNQVFPKLIPVHEVALADKLTKKSIVEFPILVSTKYDGKRVTSFVPPSGGYVQMLSRNGKEEEMEYAHIRTQVHALRDPFERLGVIRADEVLVLDGELMFGMFGSRKAQESSADYVLFDALPMHEWQLKYCERPQLKRTQQLIGAVQFAGQPNLRHEEIYIAEHMEHVNWLYGRVLDEGGEGVMLKTIDGLYRWERSGEWLKRKPVEDIDLMVIDAYEGLKESTKGMLGGLVVDFNGVRVEVGNGFSKKQRKQWWPGWRQLLGKTIEIKYTEVTPEGSLRFPRFVKVRDDK